MDTRRLTWVQPGLVGKQKYVLFHCLKFVSCSNHLIFWSSRPYSVRFPRSWLTLVTERDADSHVCFYYIQAIDISSNLHNKVTKGGLFNVHGLKSIPLTTLFKAYAAKALRELHQNKEVEGRVAGKWSNQTLVRSWRVKY